MVRKVKIYTQAMVHLRSCATNCTTLFYPRHPRAESYIDLTLGGMEGRRALLSQEQLALTQN